MKRCFILLVLCLLAWSRSVRADTTSVVTTAAATSVTAVSKATTDTLDTLRLTGSNCTAILDSSGKEVDRVCKTRGIFRAAQVFPSFSVGAGVPALAVSLGSGNIGYLSAVDPVTLIFNAFQYRWITTSDSHKLAMWTASLGVSFSKATDSTELACGFTAMPWGIRIDNLVLGLGIRYTTTTRIKLGYDHWQVVLPVTVSM